MKLQRSTKNQSRFKGPRLTLCLMAMMVLFLMGQIIISNRLSTEGRTLATLEEKIEKLRDENKRLSADKANAASLSDIASLATKKGFSENPIVLILQPGQVVALQTKP